MRTGKGLIIFVTSILASTMTSMLYSQETYDTNSINPTNLSQMPHEMSDKINLNAPSAIDKINSDTANTSNTTNTSNTSNTTHNAPKMSDIVDAPDPNAPASDTSASTESNDSTATSTPVIPIVTNKPANDKDIAVLEKLVKDWTVAFNKRDLAATCGLFSKHIIADYRGLPQKNHDSICNGFKKIFADKSLRYEYQYKIHNIYRLDDLAVIRITWYLHVFQGDKEISSIQDEGVDVLTKNDKKQWQIINYLAYQK